MTKKTARAPRFAVHVSMRYRSVGTTHWREGQIENISRSGVLFWTKHLLAVDTPLEMSFVLPVGGKKPGVVCRGRVVRSVRPKAYEAPPGLAATILTYQFVRAGSPRPEAGNVLDSRHTPQSKKIGPC